MYTQQVIYEYWSLGSNQTDATVKSENKNVCYFYFDKMFWVIQMLTFFTPLFGTLTFFTSLITFSTPLLPSCRNQSIDLQCKPMDWFPYEENIGMEKVNTIPLPCYHRNGITIFFFKNISQFKLQYKSFFSRCVYRHGIHLDKSKNFCELYCRDESLIMSEVHSKRR